MVYTGVCTVCVFNCMLYVYYCNLCNIHTYIWSRRCNFCGARGRFSQGCETCNMAFPTGHRHSLGTPSHHHNTYHALFIFYFCAAILSPHASVHVYIHNTIMRFHIIHLSYILSRHKLQVTLEPEIPTTYSTTPYLIEMLLK